MQYAFLEKLASEGNISAQDKDRIYDTCSDIITKVAFKWKNPFKDDLPTVGEALREQGMHILTRFLLPAGGLSAAAYVANAYASNAQAKDILKVRAQLLTKPEFLHDQEKAKARFDELAKISPKAAEKPELAYRLVRDSLHSGFTRDDIQRLAQLQATYEKGPLSASNTADQVQKALSKKASENTGRLAATIVSILAEAGLGDMNKTASLPWKKSTFEKATNVAKQVLTTGAIVSGFGALVGLGAGAVNQAADIVKRKKKEQKLRDSFFEAMKRSDPNREPLHANRDKALQAFQTLTHFSPNVAADPEAARAFMNHLVSNDLGVQADAIKTLSEIEKNLKVTKGPNPFFEGLHAGTQAVGMQGALSDVTKGVLHPFVEHGSTEIRREMGY